MSYDAADTSSSGQAGDSESTDSPTETSGSTDSGEPIPADLPFAEGISIASIEANQGTSVLLCQGGSEIPPEQRAVELIHGRETLIRVGWTLDAAFVPRTVRAVLTLQPSDAAPVELVQDRYIDAPPDPSAMDGMFAWTLEPEVVRPGLRYSVALVETVAGEPPGLLIPPRVPSSGVAELGIGAASMVLRVVVIPVRTPASEVVVDPDDRQYVEEELLAAFPVQSVEVDWRPTLVYPATLQSVDEGWDILAEARDADGGQPNVYYHLLLDREGCCNSSAFNFGGIGGISNESPEAAYWGGRDAITLVEADDDWSAHTIIHELGHNHGQYHAPCGGPSGADPDYPSDPPYGPEAGIGVQGFHIVDDTLIEPFPLDGPPVKDIMSYCWPSWWSDWSWQRLLTRTRILSSWDAAAMGPSRAFLSVLVTGDRVQASVVYGPSLGVARSASGVRARLHGRLARTELPVVSVVESSETADLRIGLALPDPPPAGEELRIELGTQRLRVPTADIRGWPRG